MTHSAQASPTVIDPVCGMTIGPAVAARSSAFNDETIYFCSVPARRSSTLRRRSTQARLSCRSAVVACLPVSLKSPTV